MVSRPILATTHQLSGKEEMRNFNSEYQSPCGRMPLDFGSFLAVVALGFTFLLWGVDKLLDASDRAFAASPPNVGRFQGARRFIHGILMPMRFFLGIVFAIYGIYLLLLALYS